MRCKSYCPSKIALPKDENEFRVLNLKPWKDDILKLCFCLIIEIKKVLISGLCIGFSFVTVVEFFYYIANTMVTLCSRRLK